MRSLRQVAVGVGVWVLSAQAQANPAHDALQKMSEAQRTTALGRLLVASGERCERPSRTFFQGSHRDGSAFWSVDCGAGRAYQVMIKADKAGSTRILECSVMKALNAGECFRRF